MGGGGVNHAEGGWAKSFGVVLTQVLKWDGKKVLA